MSIISGPRPDLTPAHLAALAIGGIPVISNLLAAFGVFTPSPEQAEALTNAVNWSVPLAGLLVGGDAVVRVARNVKDAKVQTAALTQATEAPQADHILTDDERELLEGDEDLPDDDTEFESPPPDDTNTPMQPSQTGIAPVDPVAPDRP